MVSDPSTTEPQAERQRRTSRVLLNVGLLVECKENARFPFQEESHTLVVNEHGALIVLANPVEEGQKLIITNQRTGEAQECRVEYVGPSHGGKTQVGLAFERSAPGFWQLHFPS